MYRNYKGSEFLGKDKIDLNNSSEVKFWVKHLKCTEEKLRRAIDSVGFSLAAIREYLGLPYNTGPFPI